MLQSSMRKNKLPLHMSKYVTGNNTDSFLTPQLPKHHDYKCLLERKRRGKKDIKAQFFFHLYLEFLTTVLNLFQTSESVFQDVASVIKYNFQMEAQPDLVNPNQFAKSICIRVLKLQLMNQLCIHSTRLTIGLV